jgi:hypothetical protein
MKKIKVELKNCYGIKKLEHEFDFSKRNVIAIYAPNGMMKSSFAKTFKDVSDKVVTTDRIYPNRITERNIVDEIGVNVGSESVFVIEPYNEAYKSDKISTLLVNKDLRQEYENTYEEINRKKQELLRKLKVLSGLKKEQDVEDAIIRDIPAQADIFKSLRRLKDDVNEYQANGFEDVLYLNVFNEKSEKLLQDKNVMDNLSEYISTLDKLLDTSRFFKKGIFTHNNATIIANQLTTNGWFQANHSVNIQIDNKDGTFTEQKITTEAELEAAITQEKNAIINDADLLSAFTKLDNTLMKNADYRAFRDYLEQHKDILPELQKPQEFKDKLWVAYLAQNKVEYNELLESYEASKKKIDDIIKAADNERTQWQKVITEFNDRYSVPFKLKMSNQSDVILQSKVPAIKFEFVDGEDVAQVDEQDLIKVLSQGEKRALYILNIIFEVEARKSTSQQTLFVIDDIADSFDYKNKYAIIEYLRDIAKTDDFKLIILTHNFDFFRSVLSRLEPPRGYYATKYTDEIKLEEPTYSYKNPFDVWKKFQNPKHAIASIPFVRNLAEFCGNKDLEAFMTSLLHHKAGTAAITIKQMHDKFDEIICKSPDGGAIVFPDKTVLERIYELADGINRDIAEKMVLEDKVILSIAIRLKMEKILIDKINDQAFVNGISKYQTRQLSDKYKELFPKDATTLAIIDRVNLMTPENIHINSFMFEPILDMSNEYLKKLYSDVSALK